MTSKRAATLLGLGLGLLTTACDPARTGYFHGDFPSPVSIDTNYFEMTMRHRWDVRRWSEDRAATLAGGSLPWEDLAYELDDMSGINWFESYSGSAVVLGTVRGAPDYVYMVTDQGTNVQPTGPSGQQLTLPPGFHVFRRTCTAADPNHFDEVALDTKLVYDETAAANEVAGLEPHLEACGIHVAPTLDLGDKVGTLPPAQVGTLPVTDLAWAPASDVVYLLAGTLLKHDVEILSYRVGTTQLSQVTLGDYLAPLEVATGGTSLLVNRASVPSSSANGGSAIGASIGWSDRVRLSLVSSDLPSVARLPLGTNVPLGASPMGLLSPDGRTLAVGTGPNGQPDLYLDQPALELIDVGSAGISNPKIGAGMPLAWDPFGSTLLVRTSNSTGGLQLLPVDGSTATDAAATASAPYVQPTFTPSGYARHRPFWTASGPKVLIQGNFMEDEVGVRVYDFVTGKTTVFVEPNHEAPPSASLGVVVATEQAFAWSIECLGLGETFCTSELRRLSLLTGAIDVVARADGPLLFAVSPDGSKIAIVYKDSVYLKTIQP